MSRRTIQSCWSNANDKETNHRVMLVLIICRTIVFVNWLRYELIFPSRLDWLIQYSVINLLISFHNINKFPVTFPADLLLSNGLQTPDEASLQQSPASSRQNKSISNNCPRSCPSITTPQEPVCGSDGLIYANSCEMKKKTCSRNGAISVKVSSSCCGDFFNMQAQRSNQFRWIALSYALHGTDTLINNDDFWSPSFTHYTDLLPKPQT